MFDTAGIPYNFYSPIDKDRSSFHPNCLQRLLADKECGD